MQIYIELKLYYKQHTIKVVVYLEGTLSNTFPELLGMYDTLGLLDNDCAIALLASIFRKVTKASPALSRACEIVLAASASPSARMTEA